MKKISLVVVLMLSSMLFAADFYPKDSRINKPDPVASPLAEQGGLLKEYLGASPKSLNYLLDNNVMSARVFGAMFESLIEMDSSTLEYDRALAEKWTISDDKLEFTFWLDPAARWSDGKPVTAEDVVWTYKTIVDPKNMTGAHKLALERLEVPEIVDDGKAVRFRAKEVHWQNLGACGGMEILPKHIWEGKDFNKINFEFPVVSGPYRIKELKEGFYLVLERRHDWWRNGWKNQQNLNNFDEIRCVFFEEQDNAFEAFLKGEIDVFHVYTASQWHKIEERVPAVRQNWIVKQSIYNYSPVGFQGFAMNMRRPPFDDVRVRKALAHLVDRETMNTTMMYSQYFMHRSFWEDLYDAEHPCKNELVKFDPAAARKLLAEAGWKVNPATGILEKNGKEFSFVFLNRGGNSDKYVTMFGSALKDVGIKMTIETKDWSAWAKDMDAYNFDMTWAAWSSGLFKNPESMWSSKEADREGGSNLTGFRNAAVDALIEKQKAIFSVTERNEICRQIDKIVYDEFPYVLLWNINYIRLLYWNKFGTPKTVLGKYDGGGGYSAYWWIDEDAVAELEEARKGNEALPARPKAVKFE